MTVVIIDSFTEGIAITGYIIPLNAFIIAALVTQNYTPPPTIFSNILLIVLSSALFVSAGMIIIEMYEIGAP